jgi:hypothetical protein
VTAVTISLVSLLLSIGNGDAMKQLVAANSWPFVSVGVGNRDEQGGKTLRIVAQNKGVGPAKIETLEVFYKGQAMADSHALIHAILGPAEADVQIPFGESAFVGDVLASKETAIVMSLQGGKIAPADLEKLAAGTANMGFRTCYCSVFNECWVSDRTRGISPPALVKTCPTPKTPFNL